jgi:tetratricopeptide (TPR) repeat protein
MTMLVSVLLLVAGAAAIAGSIYYHMYQKRQPPPRRAPRKPSETVEMQLRRQVLAEVDRLRAESAADPENPALLNELGVALLKANEGREALLCLTRAVMGHRRPAYLNNLGLAHLSMHNLAAAEESFEAAHSMDPQAPDHWYNLARAIRLNGRPEEADAQLVNLLSYFPEHADALVERAYCLQSRGMKAEAVKFLEHEVMAAPHVAAYRLALIQILCEQKHFPAARPHLQWLQEHGDSVHVDAADGDVRVTVNGHAIYEGLVA